METLVLLARREPMPVDLDLAEKLAGLPRQPALDSRTVAWFDNGCLVTREIDPVTRSGPKKGTSASRRDPGSAANHQGSPWQRFSANRAVSVASKGE